MPGKSSVVNEQFSVSTDTFQFKAHSNIKSGDNPHDNAQFYQSQQVGDATATFKANSVSNEHVQHTTNSSSLHDPDGINFDVHQTRTVNMKSGDFNTVRVIRVDGETEVLHVNTHPNDDIIML